MKRLLLLLLVLLSGCAIHKFVPPPYAAAVVTHARFFGLDASIPTGSATIGVKLGWGSVTWSVIPVCTNQVFAAPISDTFKLGQGLNPFETSITEDVISGYTSAGQTNSTPPASRHQQLFLPRAR